MNFHLFSLAEKFPNLEILSFLSLDSESMQIILVFLFLFLPSNHLLHMKVVKCGSMLESLPCLEFLSVSTYPPNRFLKPGSGLTLARKKSFHHWPQLGVDSKTLLKLFSTRQAKTIIGTGPIFRLWPTKLAATAIICQQTAGGWCLFSHPVHTDRQRPSSDFILKIWFSQFVSKVLTQNHIWKRWCDACITSPLYCREVPLWFYYTVCLS